MHLSLLLLIAGFQAMVQTQDSTGNPTRFNQSPAAPVSNPPATVGEPEMTASRIPHFRSVLKTPSTPLAGPQTPASQSPPPANSFVPPATPNFSPSQSTSPTQSSLPVKQATGESSNFSPINSDTTSPLRSKMSNAANGSPFKSSSPETQSTPPSASAPSSSGQSNSIQSTTPPSPNVSPKASAVYPPARETQTSQIPKGGSRATFNQSQSSFADQKPAAGRRFSLMQGQAKTADPKNSANSPSTNPQSSVLGTNTTTNSSNVNTPPTIEPRGTMQRNYDERNQTNTRPSNSTQAMPIQEQSLDLTYDPQLKEIAESILRSNPRGETNRVGLADVVQIARSAAQRKQIIREYWTGFVNQADADFAAQERSILQKLSQPKSRFEQTLIRAAIRSSEARLAEANLEMAKSNSRIYTYMPSLTKGQELVYADLPWVGKYKTNATQLVSTGRFDSKILNVDKALVGVRDLVQLRAASVYENMNAMQEAITEYQNGRVQLSVVVMLHNEVRDQRIAFLTSVRDYNVAIADFAVTAYPSAVDPLLVAGMLVDTQKTLPKIDLLKDRQIRQASGIENLGPGKNGVRGTAIRGTADPVVRQAGGY